MHSICYNVAKLMKIIGHRGAAGLALENTIASIRAAIAEGVDGVEFDVRQTKDGHFVLCHNATLWRVGGHNIAIADSSLEELQGVTLRNGEKPATLNAALVATGNTLALIEAKSNNWAEQLARDLADQDPHKLIVIARSHTELRKFHQLIPDVPIYLVQRFNPIDVLQAIRDAHRIGCTGVDLNFWLLNPLTYWFARKHKLDIIVYTVNSPLIARFLAKLFPDISITTNHPHRMNSIRHIASTKQITHTSSNVPKAP